MAEKLTWVSFAKADEFLRIGEVVNLYNNFSLYHRARRIAMVTLLGVSTERGGPSALFKFAQ